MLDLPFGIEIEFTGITRAMAALYAGNSLGTHSYYPEGDSYFAKDKKGRIWWFVYDGSIRCQRKTSEGLREADKDYSVELVSPVLTYREDIELLQKLVRKMREMGALTNSTCGIHIHVDGSRYCADSLKNLITMVGDRNELFYKAFHIARKRQKYCQPLEESLLRQISSEQSLTLGKIEQYWYQGYEGSRNKKYHKSRYHILNLHCFFHGNRTIELRGFNSTLHAGKVRAYVVFALALNQQALMGAESCNFTYELRQGDNRKAMMTFLVRIGMQRSEFDNCRMHICRYLS